MSIGTPSSHFRALLLNLIQSDRYPTRFTMLFKKHQAVFTFTVVVQVSSSILPTRRDIREILFPEEVI